MTLLSSLISLLNSVIPDREIAQLTTGLLEEHGFN